jgi:hypothetical protein
MAKLGEGEDGVVVRRRPRFEEGVLPSQAIAPAPGRIALRLTQHHFFLSNNFTVTMHAVKSSMR